MNRTYKRELGTFSEKIAEDLARHIFETLDRVFITVEMRKSGFSNLIVSGSGPGIYNKFTIAEHICESYLKGFNKGVRTPLRDNITDSEETYLCKINPNFYTPIFQLCKTLRDSSSVKNYYYNGKGDILITMYAQNQNAACLTLENLISKYKREL